MLVVKIEVWPYGEKEGAELVGLGTITNDGTGTGETGNYAVRIGLREQASWRTGRVEGFPRQAGNVWELLAAAVGIR